MNAKCCAMQSQPIIFDGFMKLDFGLTEFESGANQHDEAEIEMTKCSVSCHIHNWCKICKGLES